jgi:hypothetical protein
VTATPHIDCDPRSPFPNGGDRRLIPRLGRNDKPLLDDFEGFATPLICQSVSDAKANPGLAVRAVDLRLARVLDPECDNNQLRCRARSSKFQKLEYSLRGRWTGARPRLGKLIRYIERTLEEERASGTHAFIAPNHVAGGAWTESRQTELLIQSLAHDYFSDEGLQEPSPGDPLQRRRAFFIGATFAIKTLIDPHERRRLIAVYRSLLGDAFWVRIDGLSDRATPEEVEAASEFLIGLHVASGRPVVIVGPGNLGLPYLASGLSTCLGFGSHEYYSAPEEKDPTGSKGFNWVAVHRPLLRNVSPRHPNDFAHAAFAAFPCTCGYHPANQPPANGTPRRQHSVHCRVADWFSLGSVPVSQAEVEMERRIALAEAGGRTLREPRPFPAAVFRAVKTGADQAREGRERWRDTG